MKNRPNVPDGANPRPFGTSGMSPADPASRAGGMPEASGDSSSGTLADKMRLIALILAFQTFTCLAQTEQEILDQGGLEASRVIDKAYEQLGTTEIFEFPDVGWGTPSASCWGLTVLIRYDPKEAADRFSHIVTSTDKLPLRIYALIGLSLLKPDEPQWRKKLEDPELLNSSVYVMNGDVMYPATVAELLKQIKEGGGYESLLFPSPIPRLYATNHPFTPERK